jgi:serine/threonine protein kinase
MLDVIINSIDMYFFHLSLKHICLYIKHLQNAAIDTGPFMDILIDEILHDEQKEITYEMDFLRLSSNEESLDSSTKLSTSIYSMINKYISFTTTSNINLLELNDMKITGSPSPAPSSSSEYSDMDNYIGKKINNYTIISLINKGSYGSVYLAHSNGAPYAIKIIEGVIQKRLQQKAAKYSIQKEIAIMKKINHVNIIKLIEAVLDINNNTMYLIMDYLPNGSILHKLSETTYQPLPKDTVKIYMKHIVHGLTYLHKHHIIHRDIKPDNILLDAFNVPTLIDFGISSIDTNKSLYNMKGTICFMSPEIIDDNIASYASDVWALGITLFIMLYGYLPFIGFDSIRYNEIIYPDEATDAEKDILDKMLCKDPDKRIKVTDILKCQFFVTDIENDDDDVFGTVNDAQSRSNSVFSSICTITSDESNYGSGYGQRTSVFSLDIHSRNNSIFDNSPKRNSTAGSYYIDEQDEANALATTQDIFVLPDSQEKGKLPIALQTVKMNESSEDEDKLSSSPKSFVSKYAAIKRNRIIIQEIEEQI